LTEHTSSVIDSQKCSVDIDLQKEKVFYSKTDNKTKILMLSLNKRQLRCVKKH